MGLRARHDPPAALCVRSADRIDTLRGAGFDVALLVEAVDDTSTRKVGSDHGLAQVVGREIWVVDEPLRGGHDLAQVVRRDVGRHADRDAGRAVDDQVRDARRQDGRLLMPVVVVWVGVDGLFVDVGEHLVRDRREARLGVPHVGGRVVVDRVVREHAGREREVLRRVDGQVVHVRAAGGLHGAYLLTEAGGNRKSAGPVQTLWYGASRKRHQLVLRFELLRLAVRPVAEHEPVVGSADDLGACLERDLHDRVVAPNETWCPEWFDADVAVRVDREDLRAQAFVRHLDELGERLLLAVIELDLGVAGKASEVPLPLYQRIPRREVLRKPDEGVIDRSITVGVVLAHHVPDGGGGLPERPVVPKARLVHRVENPALHRFEAVADIRQRASDDHAHRVVEVRLTHLVLELDADHALVLRFFDHCVTCSISRLRLETRSRLLVSLLASESLVARSI